MRSHQPFERLLVDARRHRYLLIAASQATADQAEPQATSRRRGRTAISDRGNLTRAEVRWVVGHEAPNKTAPFKAASRLNDRSRCSWARKTTGELGVRLSSLKVGP